MYLCKYVYLCIYIYMFIYTHLYIYTHIHLTGKKRLLTRFEAACESRSCRVWVTPHLATASNTSLTPTCGFQKFEHSNPYFKRFKYTAVHAPGKLSLELSMVDVRTQLFYIYRKYWHWRLPQQHPPAFSRIRMFEKTTSDHLVFECSRVRI